MELQPKNKWRIYVYQEEIVIVAFILFIFVTSFAILYKTTETQTATIESQ